jgi:hypothetical protein
MARHILADQPEEYIQAQVILQFLTFVAMEITIDHRKLFAAIIYFLFPIRLSCSLLLTFDS